MTTNECMKVPNIGKMYMFPSVCDRQRHATQRGGCFNNEHQDMNSEKTYACPTITPSFYPNLLMPMIGKRPVYTERNYEYHIPEILLRDQNNLIDSEFNCIQPNWNWNCK